MSDDGSVAPEAEHAGISRMPLSPARPVDIQAVRPRRWREPNSDWRTVVRPPTKPSGDSPYVAPDLSGLKIADENSNNNAFRIDVNLLRQKQGDPAPECSPSNDICSSTNEKTGSPRLSISESSLSTTPASPKAPKLKPQLGKSDTRGRAARLSTSSSAIPVRATFQYPASAYTPSGNGTVQYSPVSPRREDIPPRPKTRRGRDEDRRLSLGSSEEPPGVAGQNDTVVHPPTSGATKPRFRRPRTMYKVAACQDMSAYIKMATECQSSTPTQTATEARRGVSGSDTSMDYAEVLRIGHEEPQSKDAVPENTGYSFFMSEIPPDSQNVVENVRKIESEPLENDKNIETNPYEYRNVTGFDPDEYILDLFDQGRITATQKRQAYSSGVEFPDSAYHIERMFGLHGEKNALFLDNSTPVSTARQTYSFDDQCADLLDVGAAHNTMEDIIYSYEHGGLGNGGTGHRNVKDEERAWSKLLVDLTEVEGLIDSSNEPQKASSGRKKQKKAKKKGSTRKPERRKSEQSFSRKAKSPNPSSMQPTETPGLNELKLAPPGETKLTAMYSETPEARRYREVRDVNNYVTMMDNRKSILDQFGPDPTGKRKSTKPRPAPRPHDPLSAQLEGAEGLYHSDTSVGVPMTENTQNAIAFLYGDKEVFERRPSGFFTKAAADAAACQPQVSMATANMDADLGDDWATLSSSYMD